MNLSRDQLLTLVALIVVSVWAVTTLASLIIRDYTALGIVTTVVVPVCTFLFAIKRNGNGGDK